MITLHFIKFLKSFLSFSVSLLDYFVVTQKEVATREQQYGYAWLESAQEFEADASFKKCLNGSGQPTTAH